MVENKEKTLLTPASATCLHFKILRLLNEKLRTISLKIQEEGKEYIEL